MSTLADILTIVGFFLGGGLLGSVVTVRVLQNNYVFTKNEHKKNIFAAIFLIGSNKQEIK